MKKENVICTFNCVSVFIDRHQNPEKKVINLSTTYKKVWSVFRSLRSLISPSWSLIALCDSVMLCFKCSVQPPAAECWSMKRSVSMLPCSCFKSNTEHFSPTVSESSICCFSAVTFDLLTVDFCGVGRFRVDLPPSLCLYRWSFSGLCLPLSVPLLPYI